jgi:hypothetical protein
MSSFRFPLAILTLALAAGSVHAQSPSWRVVAAESGSVLSSELPAGVSRGLTDSWIGDVGAQQFGFRVSSPSGQAGYWAQRGTLLRRYAQLNASDATGPGRSGGESAHVFLSLSTGEGGAGPDGQRSFAGRAADPAAPTFSSHGLWRWDTQRNIEVARSGTDGVLGPGLGPDWRFPNSAFADSRMLAGGALVLSADVQNLGGQSHQFIGKHVPGQGNQPCLRTSAVEPALAPGLSAGDFFPATSAGLSRLSVTRDGRVYQARAASGSRSGIWELCSGAPRALAANAETFAQSARGPDITPSTAVFRGFEQPLPAGGARLSYFADWSETAISAPRTGLFHFDGSRHRGLAYNEPSGFHGPNWAGASWQSFSTSSLSVAGDYAAFSAGVSVPSGGTPDGLWRVRVGERPELLALVDLAVPPFEPEPGRTWRSFRAVAVLSNGDVVVDAITRPGDTEAIWLLSPGQAPRKILQPGQTVSLTTSAGVVQATVSSFTNPPGGGARYSGGLDSWIGADGTLLLTVNLTTYGRALVTTRLDVPSPDFIHADSFD